MRQFIYLYAAFICAVDATYTIRTGNGPVFGDTNDIAVYWKGIPYAAPPIGNLRWQPPRQPHPWTAPLNATQWGPACPQTCHAPAIMCPLVTNEDCLTLNVFRPPSAEPRSPLPVMVWFHGGNFEFGAGGVDIYDGSLLALAGNVVVVTVNYRLGALGFLHVAGSDITGSYGFLDQQLALTWVKENIAYFSGDPTSVTIFGQSAGGAAVAAHLAAPTSWPLFHRAIVQSHPYGLPSTDAVHLADLAAAFTNATGCPLGDARCLRSLPADVIVAAQEATQHQPNPRQPLSLFLPWTPLVDKRLIPEQPLIALREGRTRPATPVLAGHTLNETSIFVSTAKRAAGVPKLAPEHVIFAFQYLFGPDLGAQVIAHYGIANWTCADCVNDAATIGDHLLFKCPQRWALSGQASASRETAFGYRFDHILSRPTPNPDADGGVGPLSFCYDHPCHGEELPFTFGAPIFLGWRYNMTFTPEERSLAGEMIKDWAHFARHGFPTFDALNTHRRGLYWRYATPGDVGGTSSPLPGPDADHCDFWDKLGYLPATFTHALSGRVRRGQ